MDSYVTGSMISSQLLLASKILPFSTNKVSWTHVRLGEWGSKDKIIIITEETMTGRVNN